MAVFITQCKVCKCWFDGESHTCQPNDPDKGKYA
jgi:hypothetical protein